MDGIGARAGPRRVMTRSVNSEAWSRCGGAVRWRGWAAPNPRPASVAARRRDPERQRYPPAIRGPEVEVARPPIDRVLDESLEAQPCSDQGGHDLAERPGPRELPALVVLGDRRA